MGLYNVSGPGVDLLWHQRRILGEVAHTDGSSHSHSYALFTPDGDVYLEDYSGRNSCITAVRFSASRRALPGGAPRPVLTASPTRFLPMNSRPPRRPQKMQLKTGGALMEDPFNRHRVYYLWERRRP